MVQAYVSSNSEQFTGINDWKSIVTLVVFFLTNLTIIFPFRVPLPKVAVSVIHFGLVKCRVVPHTPEPLRQQYFPVNFLTAPTIAVLSLLACKAINSSVLRLGILGADGVEPINIMALFISLAYLSISLDTTGLLRFLALWVVKRCGSSGRKLHLYLYLFFLTCATIVGNDPVILSGTAFLAYLTRISGISPPTAWIFSQFAAANMGSVVLISSNPTNLVLSGAFSLSFATYTSSVILPFLAAALIVYPFLSVVLFRSTVFIPPRIELSGNDAEGGIDHPSSALSDKTGAIFGSILLLVTLGVLVGTSTVGVPVWQVAVPPAAMMLSHDIWRDWRCCRAHWSVSQEQQVEQVGLPSPTTVHAPVELRTLPPSASQLDVHKPGNDSKPRWTLSSLLSTFIYRYAQMLPTAHAVFQKLPLTLVPFAFLMFILVQGLASQGWVHVFAGWWETWVNKTGVIGAVAGMVIGSGLLCNICGTNIGTTILLARMLQKWESLGKPVATDVRYASVYGLALGSNYGAFTLTFSASLAGLLWRNILGQKGVHVWQSQFAQMNLGTFVIASLASGTVLIGQMLVVHHRDDR
ncbi:hypothetical protein B0F90DRAFT_1816498 [Multifurca ochricompacta]|uniref:Citrate transporter-like domain-containing protein n=1 Tax=Multifurca ochricompacta TaxID=376703 RepID=A0AAD4M5C6_9AGAM|nr:hypothetical protein B0F90DRAFT_1816498 [Multifurca ochricompacta]